MSARYTCVGSVRGCCEIAHKTIATAARCCERDQKACASLPGGNCYSDRQVVRILEDASPKNVYYHGHQLMFAYPLTADQIEELYS